MIHITEDKLKAAIQICLGGDSIYTEQREAKLVHDIKALSISDASGILPLTKEHQCFKRGHAFYLVCEIDNGRSKYGDHKCSRCGHVEPFQYDYGSL